MTEEVYGAAENADDSGDTGGELCEEAVLDVSELSAEGEGGFSAEDERG